VNNPICTPSRASILTGKHLPGHNVYKLYDILPDEEVLFTKRLQEKKYLTALFGKLHVSSRVVEDEERHPNDGFDIYEYCISPHQKVNVKYNGYAKWLKEKHPAFLDLLEKKGRTLGNIPKETHFTRWAADSTIDFIKQHKGSPFFCYMSLVDPHDPYSDFPSELLDSVKTDSFSDSDPAKTKTGYEPFNVKRERESGILGNYQTYSKEQREKMKTGYYASVAFIDEEVGRVLQVLEEEQLKDNTLVIFTSDHGDMLGDKNLLGKGATFYDPCTKVPLIMRFPKEIPTPVINDSLVQLHDIAATVLKRAGYSRNEIKEYMPDSIDLVDVLNDKQHAREHAVCMYRNSGISSEKKEYWDPPINATMYRDNRYKLNVYHTDKSADWDQEGELYDMAADPKENNNLWSDELYQTVKYRLMGQLMDWFVMQDNLYNSTRSKEIIPDSTQKILLNPL
jgi:arylsulfatase A-like enzyme